MALTEEELKTFREEVESAHRPFVLFDDDCDGLASFLQVYNYNSETQGVPVKDSPEVDEKYAKIAAEYHPDLIIVLDKPYVSDDFVRAVNTKILWLDHHDPQSPNGHITYMNPRRGDDEDNRPTSYWVYRSLQDNLWIAMTGTVADWYYPEDLADEFREEYPGWLPESVSTPEAAIHDSRLGEMTRVWSFNLKGTVEETLESIEMLKQVKEPEEIFEQSSESGKYVYEEYDKMVGRYEELLESVDGSNGNVVVFTYKDEDNSYTSDLANEVLYNNPDKVVIVGRVDDGWVKCSVRSPDINVEVILQECLKEVRGSGGGHAQACGCAVHEDDFDIFVSCMRERVDEVRD